MQKYIEHNIYCNDSNASPETQILVHILYQHVCRSHHNPIFTGFIPTKFQNPNSQSMQYLFTSRESTNMTKPPYVEEEMVKLCAKGPRLRWYFHEIGRKSTNWHTVHRTWAEVHKVNELLHSLMRSHYRDRI